jgi:signal transduction histidine kinase
VVWRAIEASQHLINAAGHRLQVSVPTHRIELVADEARLVQAVTNILNNAAKYAPSGGHIWVNALEGANEAAITVRDDGPGIAADELATIFEPFSRGAGSCRSGHAGFGVGLALSQSLVRMHGGRIDVLSAGAGTGSEFTIRLPLQGLGPGLGAALPRPPSHGLESRGGK